LNIWTVTGAVIYKNGNVVGSNHSVALLLYYNGFFFHENTSSQWYGWNGGDWTPLNGDPRQVAYISASGDTIPSLTQLVDSSLNFWTLTAGVVYVDGNKAGYSADVTLLEYYNGKIYQENSSSAWFYWNGSSWTATTKP
jgi:hypothetical protein